MFSKQEQEMVLKTLDKRDIVDCLILLLHFYTGAKTFGEVFKGYNGAILRIMMLRLLDSIEEM